MPSSDVATSALLAMLEPEFLQDPYPVYAALSRASPLFYAPQGFGLGAFVATEHAVCSSALRSKQFGNEVEKLLPPEKLAQSSQSSAKLHEIRQRSMLYRDPPDHTRLRGLVSQSFTPRTIERLRPHIVELAEQLIVAMEEKGSADLIADFAFPLPVIVIAELLGVPIADRAQLKDWSTDATLALNPAASEEDVTKALAAIEAMDSYLSHVVAERRGAPRDDLISDLIAIQSAGDKLSASELTTTCRLLLTAGHETTVNLLGNGMLALIRNPQERQLLCDHPELVAGAVDELLRYDSPLQMTMRFALEDVQIGETLIKRTDPVMLLIGAANRDPQQFSEPDRLDVQRANAHNHLAFGQGIHYCLGASLARLEGEVAIGALLRRLPRLALAPGPLVYRPSPVFRGLKSLAVTLS
jgi:cytochrome P450